MYCFKLYENTALDKLMMLETILSVVENGCFYSHLCYDLPKYLTDLEKITTEQLQFNAQSKTIHLIYHFSMQVSFGIFT